MAIFPSVFFRCESVTYRIEGISTCWHGSHRNPPQSITIAGMLYVCMYIYMHMHDKKFITIWSFPMCWDTYSDAHYIQVKCDSDEDTDSTCVYEQVIAHLSRQLEKQSLSLDASKHSETNLQLSLRLAEQRALEAETKLIHAAERYVHGGSYTVWLEWVHT